jgi:hypothetical protein
MEYVYRRGEPRIKPRPDHAPYVIREPKEPVIPRFDPALCGQMPGFRQHRRFEEEPCRECQDAHNRYQMDYRAKKRRGGPRP